jgi:tryptophan-rich hypothetical protein
MRNCLKADSAYRKDVARALELPWGEVRSANYSDLTASRQTDSSCIVCLSPDDTGSTATSPQNMRRPSPISPNKLLLSKWTAAIPHHKEKHFIVTKLIQPEPPAVRIESVEIEAIHSRRSVVIPWRELKDSSQWLQGWL